MLDSNDKKYIKETIEKALNGSEPKLRKRKSSKLSDKVKAGEATLAERIEFEKIKRFDDLVADAVKNTARVAYNAASGIKNSKLGGGALRAFIYSNPITAFLAENEDLLKILGKGASGLFSGIKNIKNNPVRSNVTKDGKNYNANSLHNSQSTSLVEAKNNILPLNSKKSPLPTEKLLVNNGNNYILAKNALFNGGNNYININLPFGNYGAYNSANYEQEQNPVRLLTGSTNQRLITASNNTEGSIVKEVRKQTEQAKEVGKILSGMNKKIILISAGILLGVSAITALAFWLQNKLKNYGNKGQQSSKRFNNRTNSFISSSSSVTGLSNDTVAGMFSLADGKTEKVQEFNFKNKFGGRDIKKLNDLEKNKVVSKEVSQLIRKSNVSTSIQNFKNQDNKQLRFKLPVPIKIIEKVPSPTDESFLTILIQKDDLKSAASKNPPKLIIDRVTAIIAPNYLKIPADTPFAIVDSNYQIIGDLSEFMKGAKYDEYINSKNLAQDKEKINKFRTNDVIKTQIEQDKFLQKQLDLGQAIAETPLGKGINVIKGMWNDLMGSGNKNLSSTVNSLDQVNKANKNVEIAKNQANKANFNELNIPLLKVPEPNQNNNKNISLSMQKSGTRIFGLTQPLDIIQAGSSIIEIA